MYKFILPDTDELLLALFSCFEILPLNISLASYRDIDILEVKLKFNIVGKDFCVSFINSGVTKHMQWWKIVSQYRETYLQPCQTYTME